MRPRTAVLAAMRFSETIAGAILGLAGWMNDEGVVDTERRWR